jgi:hypothetical protein
MVIDLRFRASVIGMCFLALLIIGCDSNSTGPSNVASKAVTVEEGTTFTYEDFSSYQGQESRDTTMTELLSKIATIGGREGLLAYQWLPNGVISFWEVDPRGDMWMFYIVDPTVPGEEKGVWVHYPTSGGGSNTVVLWDTTLSNGHDYTRRFRDRQTSQFVGTERIVVEGRWYDARTIETLYESDHWENGVHMIDASYSYTMQQSFVLELGVMVRNTVKLEGESYTSTRTLIKIESN